MQYVRNTRTNAKTKEQIEDARVRTIGRKLQEMRYALAMRRRCPTADPRGYLNVSYFGGAGACRSKRPHADTSTSAHRRSRSHRQRLLRAGSAASRLRPTAHPKIGQVRRDVVPDRMANQGYITAAEAASAKAIPIQKTLKPKELRERLRPKGTRSPTATSSSTRSRMTPATARQSKIAKTSSSVAAWTIKSSLDLKAQASAQQQSIDGFRRRIQKKAAAIAMVEPATGSVIAMAQNRRWGTTGPGVTTCQLRS